MAPASNVTFTLFTAIFLAAVGLISADETCYGYWDDDGDWHDSFDCNTLFDGGIYCCGTITDKYCCYDESKRIEEEDQLSAAIIATIVVIVVLVVVIAVVIGICVCCCNACAACCRTSTTTTYVHGAVSATPTVVVASSHQSSVIPGTANTSTVADNPMYSANQYPPPYPGQKY